MRILIHSNAPWAPTGYGLQTRLLMEQLRQDGHTVAVSAFAGLHGADVRWHGHLIMPAAQMDFGIDVLVPHMNRFGADLTITLMDTWKMERLGEVLRGYNMAAWMPIDCAPVGRRDMGALSSTGMVPIAMSRHGQSHLAVELGGTGDVPYAPHAVDIDAYAPMVDRVAYREELGVADDFVVGICAANKDNMRKGWPEQFRGFANFHARHPHSVLLVHSTARNLAGLDLYELAADMGISSAVRFTENYVVDSGLMGTDMMRRWYSALDVLSLCSYAEGFGVPLIESQACGTPVVTADSSAMTELVGPGWLVGADEFWNPLHRAWWRRPRIAEITKAYGAAYRETAPAMQSRRERAREFALGYATTTVFDGYWRPILKEMTV
jgi:glycosyltransferase involved in cell wall biosynthesis